MVKCVKEVPNKAHYVQLLTDSLHLGQLQHNDTTDKNNTTTTNTIGRYNVMQ